MGFFSKQLKANMNHGGVTVRVVVPSAVASNQAIPVQVTLTADSAQVIVNVKAELKAQAKEQGITLNGGVGVQSGTTGSQTVAVAESREQFTLNPGEPKTVTLQLYMNSNAASVKLLGMPTNANGVLGGVLQSAVSAVQGFDHINFVYTVHASADVEGITLDPSDKQPIQILPPAETAQPTVLA